jgi:Uma2 family endonuclease
MSALAYKLMSFQDYLTYDDQTDNRYELIDGQLALMLPPALIHILIADFLADLFKQEVKRLQLDWYCLKEVGVRTGFHKSRLPDIAIVTKAQVEKMRNQVAVFEVSPLLVVEIVSESSIKQDYRFKRTEYAALEIPEYWIVDPLENKVSVLVLEDGFYEVTEFKGTQPIVSPIFKELVVMPEQILAA